MYTSFLFSQCCRQLKSLRRNWRLDHYNKSHSLKSFSCIEWQHDMYALVNPLIVMMIPTTHHHQLSTYTLITTPPPITTTSLPPLSPIPHSNSITWKPMTTLQVMLVGKEQAEPGLLWNSSSNIEKEMLSCIGQLVQDSVWNSFSNIGNKILTKWEQLVQDSLLNSSSNIKYKTQHSIKLFGMHWPRNRGNINYNRKECGGGIILVMLQEIRIPL